MPRFAALLLVLSLAAMPQVIRSTRGRKDQRDVADVAAKFNGVLAGIDKRFVRLDVEGDNTLEFRRTSKTAFFKGKAQVKPDQIPAGGTVLVEGSKNMAGELVVLAVIWDGKPATAR